MSEESDQFYDGSPLAEAEIKMMQLLDKQQCDAVAAWLKFYGYEWQKQYSASGEAICECFKYTANRLEILGKNGLPDKASNGDEG